MSKIKISMKTPKIKFFAQNKKKNDQVNLQEVYAVQIQKTALEKNDFIEGEKSCLKLPWQQLWNYVYSTLLDKDKLYAKIHFMEKKKGRRNINIQVKQSKILVLNKCILVLINVCRLLISFL